MTYATIKLPAVFVCENAKLVVFPDRAFCESPWTKDGVAARAGVVVTRADPAKSTATIRVAMASLEDARVEKWLTQR